MTSRFRINRPRMKTYHGMLAEGMSCIKFESMKELARKPKYIKTLVTDFGRFEGRVYHEVEVNWGRYLADKVTGSLYNMDGTSPSGGRMRLE